MEDRIKKIMAVIFEITVDEINDQSSRDNIESWDSLRQLQLIAALEEEFDLEFSEDKMKEMRSMTYIKQIIKDKMACT